MEEFYGNKIKNMKINKKTGKAWTLEDVPVHWREKTAQCLEKEGVK